MSIFLNAFRTPARVSFIFVACACIAMLGFGLYLQHVVGLEPCPMCIVQRYALMGMGLTAAAAACSRRRSLLFWGGLSVALALCGAFVAARQTWLQWYPLEVLTCGRDFYGIIESLPMRRAIPLIFKGSGDCTKVDWTFLGGSIANWSLVGFVLLAALAAHGVYRAASVKARP